MRVWVWIYREFMKNIGKVLNVWGEVERRVVDNIGVRV